MTENITQPIYRLAVISDIHGMLPTLETVLAKIMVDPPDAIIVAGDIVGGPQPHETLALLREYNCRMILGNGEDNMLSMYRGTAPDAWWTERQFDFARWVYRHLEEEDFAYLAKLPEQMKFEIEGAEPIRVVHGSPRDINKLMLPKKEPDIIQKALEMIDENYLIFGHTHTPGIYRHNGKLAVNPGALSNNLVGVPEISYAIFVWDGQVWNPEIFKSEPDFDQLKQSFIKTGFLQATFPLGRTFLESIFTGANTTVDFILHAVGLAKKDGLAEFNTIPDKYWLEAAKSFPWQFDL
jgi:putative phosphoesterase